MTSMAISSAAAMTPSIFDLLPGALAPVSPGAGIDPKSAGKWVAPERSRKQLSPTASHINNLRAGAGRPRRPLAREFRDRKIINHSAGSYVDGEIHTNTIEGFFGNMKTGMRGAYKKVSRKWLQSYVDEYAWRYNARRESGGPFEQLLARASPSQPLVQ